MSTRRPVAKASRAVAKRDKAIGFFAKAIDDIDASSAKLESVRSHLEDTIAESQTLLDTVEEHLGQNEKVKANIVSITAAA